MARTGTNENKQANQQAAGWQSKAVKSAQSDLTDYRTNEDTLKKGGNVGADPFLDPTYLGNQNKLTSYAMEGENSAAKQQLEDLDRRTGGYNTGGSQYSVRNLALGKMRLGDQLTSQRSADDFKSNLGWQQYLAGAPLAAEQGEQGLFGTATGQRTDSLDNLQKFGVASYGPWNALIQGAAGAASSALMPGGAITKAIPCWVAEAIYGVDDPRTHLVRAWLNGGFRRRPLGMVAMAAYMRFGQRVARLVRALPILQHALRPLFDRAASKAMSLLRNGGAS